MKSEIKSWVKEWERVYSGSPWLGNSMLKALEGVEAEKAMTRPLTGRHTIAELVAHVIGWRKLLLKRLQGDNAFSVRQKATFDCAVYGQKPEEIWENLLKTLEADQIEMTRLLNTKEESFLSEKVAKRNYNYRYLIKGLIQHDVYHMGQIALLK